MSTLLQRLLRCLLHCLVHDRVHGRVHGLPCRLVRLLLRPLLPGAAACLLAGAAAAFPDRALTLVVPFPAGGPSDRVAREFAQALRKPLGAEVVVENVDGAGGTLGATRVAKAPADGHTLLLFHIGMATTPTLYRKLDYDALQDFAYLGLINEVPMTLLGRRSLPANTYAELVKWLRRHPGKVSLATAGQGSASHLCGLMFQHAVRFAMTTVPYKGTAPAMNDLLGGQVDLMCDQSTHTTEPIAAGAVKAYAVSTRTRVQTPELAALPTLQEAGLKGFHVSIWHGLYAPAGTPPDRVERLNRALRAALQDPDFMRRQQALGAVVVQDERLKPAEHKRFVAAEIEKWRAVIQAAGQYAD